MFKRITILLVNFMSVIALLGFVMAQPVFAAPDINVSIRYDPVLTNPNDLQVGDIITATVHTTSASNQSVNAWGFYLDYDPSILQANSVTRLYPINGTDFCPVALTFSNTTGRIVGECADLGGGTTTDNLDVLQITFEITQTNTTFSVTFDTVCDGPTNSDCFQAVSGGFNQIMTYNQSTNNPLAVALQSVGINTAVFPITIAILPFVFLLLMATAGVILLSRQSH